MNRDVEWRLFNRQEKQMKNLDKAIKHYGSVNALAEVLAVRACTISNWKHRGVPLMIQWMIEGMTGGKVKADVPPVIPIGDLIKMDEAIRKHAHK
jgi:hypothetical protein